MLCVPPSSRISSQYPALTCLHPPPHNPFPCVCLHLCQQFLESRITQSVKSPALSNISLPPCAMCCVCLHPPSHIPYTSLTRGSVCLSLCVSCVSINYWNPEEPNPCKLSSPSIFLFLFCALCLVLCLPLPIHKSGTFWAIYLFLCVGSENLIVEPRKRSVQLSSLQKDFFFPVPPFSYPSVTFPICLSMYVSLFVLAVMRTQSPKCAVQPCHPTLIISSTHTTQQV